MYGSSTGIGDLQIAAFFDCENIPSHHQTRIISDLASRGRLLIRKAYGDFHSQEMAKWKYNCENSGIEMIQKSALNHKGKNAADMALCIDAMEMLVTRKNIQAFALVTSDGDFSPLALRLREHGKQVIGFGAHQSNRMLRQACDEYVVFPWQWGRHTWPTMCDLSSSDTTLERTATSGSVASFSSLQLQDQDSRTKEGEANIPASVRVDRVASAAGAAGPEVSASSWQTEQDYYASFAADQKQARRATRNAVRDFVNRGDADENGWVHYERLLSFMTRLQKDWASLLVNWGLRWTDFLRTCKKLELRSQKGYNSLGLHSRRAKRCLIYWVRIKAPSSKEAADAGQAASPPRNSTSECKESNSKGAPPSKRKRGSSARAGDNLETADAPRPTEKREEE